MKNNEDSFLAYRGCKVAYCKDRDVGMAYIVRVLRPTGVVGDCVFRFLVSTVPGQAEMELTDADFRLIPQSPQRTLAEVRVQRALITAPPSATFLQSFPRLRKSRG